MNEEGNYYFHNGRIYIGNYIEGIKEKYTSLNGNNFKGK